MTTTTAIITQALLRFGDLEAVERDNGSFGVQVNFPPPRAVLVALKSAVKTLQDVLGVEIALENVERVRARQIVQAVQAIGDDLGVGVEVVDRGQRVELRLLDWPMHAADAVMRLVKLADDPKPSTVIIKEVDRG